MACENCGQPDGVSCGCFQHDDLRSFLADFQAAWKGTDEPAPTAEKGDALEAATEDDPGDLLEEDFVYEEVPPPPLFTPSPGRDALVWRAPQPKGSHRPGSPPAAGESGRWHPPP